MATLNAIYKISADITNLQAGMSRAVAATENLDRTVSGATSALSRMTSVVTALATPAAIGAVVSQVVALGGELTDLAARTGLSTTELQKLRGVGNQVGVTIDTIATAVNQLQNRLAGGDQSAISALRQLGLTWQQLKDQSPDEMFRTILERLGQIPDHATMVATGTDLMGRGFKDLIPLVKEGVDELDRVKTMSPEAVRGLDELGDAWQRFKDDMMAGVGELVASLTNFEGVIVNVARTMGFSTDQMRNDWRLTKAIFEDVNKSMPKADAPKEFGKVASIALKDVMMSASALESVERQLNDQIKRSTKEMVDSAAAARKQADELERIIATDIANFYNEFAAALRNTRVVLNGLSSDIQDVGRVNVESIHAQMLAELERQQAMVNWMNGEGNQWVNHLETTAETTDKVRFSLDNLAGALTQLSQVSGGTFGNMVREIAVLVTAMNTAQKAGEQMAKGGFMNVLSGGLAAAGAIGQATETGSRGAKIGKGALTGLAIGTNPALMAATFGLSAIAGPAIGALVGAFRGRGEGRKAIEEFADSMGGFDQLRLKLRALGDEGERLWQQMGRVGSGNVKQAQAAIGALERGLVNVPAKLNEMLTATLTTGAGLDNALVPLIEDLIRTGQLTQENANLLLGLPAAGVPAFDEVAAAADALGLDMDALGQNIKQLRFTETAEGIAHHLDVLQRAGADMNAVFTGSREKIQTLVHDAQRGFLSLPESMRPFLQQMVDAGMLTDIFGDTLTDLEDLHFTKPLEDSVEDLVEAMRELVGVIRNDVGGALDELGNKVVRPRVEVDSGFMERRDVDVTGPETGGPAAMIQIPVAVQVNGTTIAEATASGALGWG